MYIRRPLPSLGLGGAAPGITVGVRHGPVLALPWYPQHRTTLRSSTRSVRLALPWCLPIGPTSCFYWASKLPRGTFWAGLKTPKPLAAAFEGLSTAQPSAAALEASCWLCHGASLLAPQAVSIGLRNCRVARFGQALPRPGFVHLIVVHDLIRSSKKD